MVFKKAQAVILVGDLKNWLKQCRVFFLELFEIVKIDDKSAEWLMDIYLDERKAISGHPQETPVIVYGFVEAVTIQDLPIRVKRVNLHLCRRKRLNKSCFEFIHEKRFISEPFRTSFYSRKC